MLQQRSHQLADVPHRPEQFPEGRQNHRRFGNETHQPYGSDVGNPPVGPMDSAHDKGYTAAYGMPCGVLPAELETEPRCPMGV